MKVSLAAGGGGKHQERPLRQSILSLANSSVGWCGLPLKCVDLQQGYLQAVFLQQRYRPSPS